MGGQCCMSNSGLLEVRVDHTVDYVSTASHRVTISRIRGDSVHGQLGEKSFRHGKPAAEKSMCGERGRKGDGEARQIVKNAKMMAAHVSDERDRLDCDWKGVNNEDPLMMLLGTSETASSVESLLQLVELLADLVNSEPSVLDVPVPAKIYGDLHGQFRDLLLFLHYYGFPSKKGHTHFIFNGDWVDRGAHQLETIALIYALKLAYPDRVWLIRGNHEDGVQNASQGKDGFPQECIRKLGQQDGHEVFQSFDDSFNYLPFGAVVGESILVIHGGIGDGTWSIGDLAAVQRPLDHDALVQNLMVYNVLWSDPIDEDQKDSFGVHTSPRDNHTMLMKRFGADITEKFCERNHINMIVRSHQALPQGNGYEVMHAEQLVRVFSARDYGHGLMRNDGSVLFVREQSSGLVVTAQVLSSILKGKG